MEKKISFYEEFAGDIARIKLEDFCESIEKISGKKIHCFDYLWKKKQLLVITIFGQPELRAHKKLIKAIQSSSFFVAKLRYEWFEPKNFKLARMVERATKGEECENWCSMPPDACQTKDKKHYLISKEFKRGDFGPEYSLMKITSQ